jgi:hypothetical protein
MTKTPTRRRGPKTPAGRIAVRLNATTHGILSAKPVVNEYERAEDWEEHRRAVVEALHTAARLDAAEKETKAEKAEAELLAERRARILPDRTDLEKIARYEAHLSRQMYQALHELEALQARRAGKGAPLARLDVQT